ncbi:MAG: hypothetical protein WB996_00085, partial [Ignavibacteriaceae bacterium]
MKNVLLAAASFLMIIVFSGSAIEPACEFSSPLAFAGNPLTLQKDKTVHKEFKVQSGKLLNLDFNTGASINVEGWDKDIVSVDAELGGRDWEDISLDFNQTSGGVDITTEYD